MRVCDTEILVAPHDPPPTFSIVQWNMFLRWPLSRRCRKFSWAQNFRCSLRANGARGMASARSTLEPWDMQCQKQSLDEALRQTQRLLKQKQRLQTRTSAIPAFGWRVVLIIYVLQEWHAAPAVRYLRDKMHRKEDEEELTCQVETFFWKQPLKKYALCLLHTM